MAPTLPHDTDPSRSPRGNRRRRSLSQAAEPAAPGTQPRRRADGRRNLSERVRFLAHELAGAKPIDGWTLNVSAGGLRAIVEDPVQLGDELDIEMSGAPARLGRIVWVQEEPDGAVVGVAFLAEAVPRRP